MRGRKLVLGAVAAFGLVAMLSTTVVAGNRGGGNTTATGPFDYSHSSLDNLAFSGMGGTVSTGNGGSFVVCAGAAGDTQFPGQGSVNTGPTSANATFGVSDILQTADVNGPLTTPTPIDLASFDGMAITNAISITPAGGTFYPGGTCIPTPMADNVTVQNPDISDYGTYRITLKAHAPGSGIGDGSGASFTLTLGPSGVDLPPLVSSTSPANGAALYLGVIPVSVTAYDPDNPINPNTGIKTVTASIASAYGNYPSTNVTLTGSTTSDNSSTTWTGSFTPKDGAATGASGDPLVFDVNPAPSGIGTYILTAGAEDRANQWSLPVTATFAVNYKITTGNIVVQDSGQEKNHGVNLFFSAQRGGAADIGASDGAYMQDQTVTVKVQTGCGSVVGSPTVYLTHTFASSDPNTGVTFDATATPPQYHTSFNASDFVGGTPSGEAQYQILIYFEDIDGNMVLQNTLPTATTCYSF